MYNMCIYTYIHKIYSLLCMNEKVYACLCKLVPVYVLFMKSEYLK